MSHQFIKIKLVFAALGIAFFHASSCAKEVDDLPRQVIACRDAAGFNPANNFVKTPTTSAEKLCRDAIISHPQVEELAAYLGRTLYFNKKTQESFNTIKRFNNLKNPLGLTLLGILYDRGYGVEQDSSKALALWEQASRSGHANAQFLVASHYLGDDPRTADIGKALPLLESAVAAEIPAAMNLRAWLIMRGVGSISQPDKALKLYAKAAALDDHDAMYNWSVLNLENNSNKALEYLEKLAVVEHSHAKALLGEITWRGRLKKKDDHLALELLMPVLSSSNRAKWIVGVLAYQKRAPSLTQEDALRLFKEVEQVQQNKLRSRSRTIRWDLGFEQTPVEEAVVALAILGNGGELEAARAAAALKLEALLNSLPVKAQLEMLGDFLSIGNIRQVVAGTESITSSLSMKNVQPTLEILSVRAQPFIKAIPIEGTFFSNESVDENEIEKFNRFWSQKNSFSKIAAINMLSTLDARTAELLLAKVLGESDAEVKHELLSVLQYASLKGAQSFVKKQLSDGDSALRLKAVNAAGKAKLALSPQQSDALLKDDSKKVRNAFLKHASGSNWLIPEEALLEGLQSEITGDKEAALLASSNSSRAVRAQLLKMNHNEKSLNFRRSFRAIRFGDEVLEAIREISEAELSSRSVPSLEVIEEAVKRTDPEQIAAPLRVMLGNFAAVERRRGLWILYRNGARQFDQLVAQIALNDEDPTLRCMAIEVLLSSEDPQWAVIFAKATRDIDPSVRRRAMEGVAIDSFNSQRYAAALSNDVDAAVRYRAALSLRSDMDPDPRVIWERLRNDPDRDVRNAANEMLGMPDGRIEGLKARLQNLSLESKLTLLCELNYNEKAAALLPWLLEIAANRALPQLIRSRAFFCSENPAKGSLNDDQVELLNTLLVDPTDAVHSASIMRVLRGGASLASARAIWSHAMTRGGACDVWSASESIPQILKTEIARPYLTHSNIWVRKRALECFGVERIPHGDLMSSWIKEADLTNAMPIETLLGLHRANAAPGLLAALASTKNRREWMRLQAAIWLTGTKEAYESAVAYRGDLWTEPFFSKAWLHALASRPSRMGLESLLLELERHRNEPELRSTAIEVSSNLPDTELNLDQLAAISANFSFGETFGRRSFANRSFSPLGFLIICMHSGGSSKSFNDLDFISSERVRVLPSHYESLRRVVGQCVDYWKVKGELPDAAVMGWAIRLFLNAGLIKEAVSIRAGDESQPYSHAAYLISSSEAWIRHGNIERGASLLDDYESLVALRLNENDRISDFTLRVMLLRGMISESREKLEDAYRYFRIVSDRAGRTATGIASFGLSLKYEKNNVIRQARWKADEDILLEQSGSLLKEAIEEILVYLVEEEIKLGNPERSLIEADRLAAFQEQQARPEPIFMVDREKEAAIRQLNELQDRILRLASSEQLSNVRPSLDPRTQLGLARQQLQGWLTEMRMRYPAMTALLRPRSVDISELRKMLAGERVLIQYIVLPKRTYIWIVTKDKEYLRVSPYSSSDIRKWVTQARTSWSVGTDEIGGAAEESITGLSKALIEPVRSVAGNADHWVVIPHSVLHSLPFSALHWGDSKSFLIEHRTISYAVSASSVSRYAQAKRDSSTKLLAIGGPTSYEGFPFLPNAAIEASNIANSFKPNSDLYVGNEARRSILLGQPLKYSVLHLAVHGELRDGYRSRLVFADGFLEVKDIWSISLLNSPTVILSACESGLGKSVTGNEVLSIATGFMVAGAQSVVSTLWKVPDQTTANLMMDFYDLSRISPTTAESLALMQRNAIRAGLTAQKWAAFVIHGY